MMTEKYKVVLMDIDGTLLDFDQAETDGIRQVMKAYGVCPDREKEKEYHHINQGLWQQFERGEIQKHQIMDTRFHIFFGSMGITVDGKEAERLYRQQLNNSALLLPGAREICAYLSEKYSMYVVTNGLSATQFHRLKISGLEQYFQGVFVSEDAGSQKPQKEFFDYCFSKIIPCAREEAVIVGDSLSSDILGGINAGVATCWYNPKKNENSGKIKPDYEICHLKQLKDIL